MYNLIVVGYLFVLEVVLQHFHQLVEVGSARLVLRAGVDRLEDRLVLGVEVVVL